MFRFSRSLASAVSVALLVIGGSVAAVADEDRKQPASGLPGVDGDYSIVQPAPEPEDAQADNTDDRKRFKAGNWDVEVSGYVSYQIGASSNGR